MKKNKFKLKLKQVGNFLKSVGSDADKDWKIVLVLFIIALAVSIGFHISIFSDVQKISNSTAVKRVAVSQPVSQASLSAMVDRYAKRKVEYDRIASSTTLLIDPAR